MDVIKKTVKDAERLLKAVRANYYIELPTGEEISHGLDGYEVRQVEQVKPERKKRTNRTGAPYGSLVEYYRPILDQCKNVGDVALIPFGGYQPEYLRGAICAHCTVQWGKGSYTSVMNRDEKRVEVLRTKVVVPKAPATKQEPTKANGGGKFRSVGHGMDALQNLSFDDEHQTRQ